MIKDNTHIYSFDIIRAMCMIYIIGYWHLIDYIPGVARVLPFSISTFLIYAALGSFTFMSGFFAGRHEVVDVRRFYIKKFFRIYVPTIISLTLMLCLHLTPLTVYFTSILGLSMIITPPPLTLWYMEMLILFFLITPFIQFHRDIPRHITLHINLLVIVLLYACVLLFGTDYRLALYFPIFDIGLLFGKHCYNLILGYMKSSITITGLSIIAFVIFPKHILELAALQFVMATIGVVFFIIL